MYNGEIIEVFVSSPVDVVEERKIVCPAHAELAVLEQSI